MVMWWSSKCTMIRCNALWYWIPLLSSKQFIRFILFFTPPATARTWGSLSNLIHGFGCGSKLEDVEGYSLGGGLGAYWYVFTLGGFETGPTLRVGTGMLVIFWSWILPIWVCGSSGGNGKICKRGWDVLFCKMWEIWLITFFVASP